MLLYLELCMLLVVCCVTVRLEERTSNASGVALVTLNPDIGALVQTAISETVRSRCAG
jgi:hypothetical protein